MKKILVTTLTATLATTLAFSSVAPIVSQAKEQTETEATSINKGQQKKLDQLAKELEDLNITSDDLALGLQEELNKNYTPEVVPEEEMQVTPFGLKSQTAKVAAKAMLSKIKSVGSTSWNKTVSEYVNKLPLTSSVKSTLKKYLGYQFVMSTLNIVIGFDGTITDALSKQLKKTGMNSFFADLVSRTIVALLL